MSDSTIHIRVIPVIELPEACTSEPVEGPKAPRNGCYGMAKKHPTAPRGYVFPHPDIENEAVIQEWLDKWPVAKIDIFSMPRFAPMGVEFVVQTKDETGKWVTVPMNGTLEVSIAVSTSSRSAGSCPAHVGAIPTTATSLPQTVAVPLHNPDYVGECSDGKLVGDPIDKMSAAIREKLAEKNYRAPELAKVIGVPLKKLLGFIESPRSGFCRNTQGWIKEVADAEPAAVAA